MTTTEILTQERKEVIIKNMLPYLDNRIRGLAEKGDFPKNENNLEKFLISKINTSNARISEILSDLYPERVSTNDIMCLYQYYDI